MKKLIVFFVMLSICFSFTGCNNDRNSNTENVTNTSSTKLLYETKDQYGNIISQTFYNDVTGEHWMKDYTYIQNDRGCWICTDIKTTVITGPTVGASDNTLKVYHSSDLADGQITLLDNDYAKISIVKYLAKDSWWEFGYELKVVNKTNQTITITISNASIMDINCKPLFSVDHIEASNTAYFTLAWDIETLERCYIPYIDNIEFMIKVFDNDNWNSPALTGTRILIKQS